MAQAFARTAAAFLRRNSPVLALKDLRNRLVDRRFRAQRREAGRELADRLRPCDAVCVTIAFNTPWVIDILTAAWRVNVSGMTLVVADNSSETGARQEIADICAQRGVAYIALPSNPEWNPNRSHGIAMNWAYYNLVRPLAPAVFGFIDHDCFPIKPVDVAMKMVGKAAYGRRWNAPDEGAAWHLWAGLCFFDFARADAAEPDFKPLRSLRLDTGGGNWPRLYSRLDLADVLVASDERLELTLAGDDSWRRVFDGTFLHLGGTSYRGKFSQAEYRKLVADHVWTTYLGGAERLVD